MAKKKGEEAVSKKYKVLTPINLGEGKGLDVGETFESNEDEVADLVEARAIEEV